MLSINPVLMKIVMIVRKLVNVNTIKHPFKYPLKYSHPHTLAPTVPPPPPKYSTLSPPPPPQIFHPLPLRENANPPEIS